MLTSRVTNSFRSAVVRFLRPVMVRVAGLVTRFVSHDDLQAVVKAARASGALGEADSAMLSGFVAFRHKKVQDVMRPRTEVVALPIDASEREVQEVLQAERYSRYPVYRESLDDVAGIFVAKDFWLRPAGVTDAFPLQRLIREPVFVPRRRPAERVLDDLRRTRAHMAIVLDEYGGTSGIVTVEDLVEQVFGEISDEYDRTVRRAMVMDGVLELDGSLSVIDVRKEFDLPIPDGEWTTLGGFAFARLGRAPHIGDRVEFPTGELEVVAVAGRRIAALRVHRQAPTGEMAVPVPKPIQGALPFPTPIATPAPREAAAPLSVSA